MGAPKCGAWLKDRKEEGWAGLADQSWLLGYLTGLSSTFGDILKEPDGESLFVWMDNYCRASPLDNVAAGGLQLAQVLQKRMAVGVSLQRAK